MNVFGVIDHNSRTVGASPGHTERNRDRRPRLTRILKLQRPIIKP